VVAGWAAVAAQAGISTAVIVDMNVEAERMASIPDVGGQSGVGATSVVDRRGVVVTWSRSRHAIAAAFCTARRSSPDIIHVHTPRLWPMAHRLANDVGAYSIFHLHSIDRAEYEHESESDRTLASGQQQEPAIFGADRLVVVSRAEREVLVSCYPHVADRTSVVRNAVDPVPVVLGRPRAGRSRQGSPLILYSGRLSERKGVRDLLAAIPVVFESLPTARLVIAGGELASAPQQVQEDWRGLARDRDRVCFTGWRNDKELAECYSSADILVVPSRYEPCGLVALEGMIRGLPVVAAETGGLTDIVRHGETGLLFRPGDVTALAASLICVASDDSLRQSVSIAGAQAVREAWLWQGRAAAISELYSDLVGGRRQFRTRLW
jgi:glycogen synthase